MPIGLKLSLPRLFVGTVLALIMVLSVANTAEAQIPDLVITVGDTVATSGEQNAVTTVFMDNLFDTVVSFSLWLRVGNSNIMEFQTDTATIFDTTYWICIDTNLAGVCLDSVGSDADTTYWICTTFVSPDCIDSQQVSVDSAWEFIEVADFMHVDTSLVTIGSFDTVGTLTSGWEFVASRSIIGNGSDIKLTAIADRLTVPGFNPGIAPQQGGVLFRLLGDVFQIEDTLTDRTSAIVVDPFKDHFGFVDPFGDKIGESDSIFADTSFYRCDAYLPPQFVQCVDSVKVGTNDPWDFFHVGIDTVFYTDTAKVKLFSGSLTVLAGACGDIDNDPGNNIDIGDLTALISFLFLGGPAPDPLSAANMDCQGVPPSIVDIGDLTWLISFLFLGGPEPCDCVAP